MIPGYEITCRVLFIFEAMNKVFKGTLVEWVSFLVISSSICIDSLLHYFHSLRDELILHAWISFGEIDHNTTGLYKSIVIRKLKY